MSRFKSYFQLPTVKRIEAFCLRILLAFTLLYFFPDKLDLKYQLHPVGLAKWFDLTWLSDPLGFAIIKFVFLFFIFAYVSGFKLRIVLPFLTLIQILPYTLMNSQGYFGHSYQILSIVLIWISISAVITESINKKNNLADCNFFQLTIPILAILITTIFFTQSQRVFILMTSLFQISLDHKQLLLSYFPIFLILAISLNRFITIKIKTSEPSELTNSWQLIAGQTAVASVYFISVISKIYISNWLWLANSPFLALDFIKSNRQSFYSLLDPKYLEVPIGTLYLLENQNIARIFFGSGLLLEFSVFIAIGCRKLSLLFGILLITMHQLIKYLMTVNFQTNEIMLLIFFVNLPYWILHINLVKPILAIKK